MLIRVNIDIRCNDRRGIHRLDIQKTDYEIECVVQGLQLPGRKLLEPMGQTVVERIGCGFQEFDAFGGERHQSDAFIVGIGNTGDEAFLLQPINYSGNGTGVQLQKFFNLLVGGLEIRLIIQEIKTEQLRDTDTVLFLNAFALQVDRPDDLPDTDQDVPVLHVGFAI